MSRVAATCGTSLISDQISYIIDDLFVLASMASTLTKRPAAAAAKDRAAVREERLHT
jgi:hypothetical protein